jgi:hypothetical protein
MQRINGGGGGSTTVLTLPPPTPPTNPETQESLSSYDDGANREAEAGGEGQGAVDDDKKFERSEARDGEEEEAEAMDGEEEEAGKITLDPLGSDPLISVEDGVPNATATVLVFMDRQDGAVDDHLQNLRREHEIAERGKEEAESTVSEVVARPASLSSTQSHLEDRGIDLSLATVRGSLPDISLACPPSPSMEEASWRYI